MAKNIRYRPVSQLSRSLIRGKRPDGLASSQTSSCFDGKGRRRPVARNGRGGDSGGNRGQQRVTDAVAWIVRAVRVPSSDILHNDPSEKFQRLPSRNLCSCSIPLGMSCCSGPRSWSTSLASAAHMPWLQRLAIAQCNEGAALVKTMYATTCLP